jgi:hypothetical protein
MPQDRSRVGAAPQPIITIMVLIILVGLGALALHGSGAIESLNAAGLLGPSR